MEAFWAYIYVLEAFCCCDVEADGGSVSAEDTGSVQHLPYPAFTATPIVALHA
jgi:hypothetical protein